MRPTASRLLAWLPRGLVAGTVTLLLLHPVDAQIGPRFGRPSQPPFGPAQPGMPGMRGGMPGMPGGMSGMPGGMSGMPGGMAGMPGGPMNNNPPFGPRPLGPRLIEHVWTCSKCGRELGRGSSLLDKPSYTSCPFCGARFINGGGFGPRLMDPPSAPPAQPPAFTPPLQVNNPPVRSAPAPATPSGPNVPAWSDNSSTADAPDSASTGKALAIGGGIAFVSLGLVGGIVFAIVYGSGGGKKRRRRRRYRDDDDEYDDDDY